jgi:hypothetical protein
MLKTLFRAVLIVAFAGVTGFALAQDDEPPCNYCRTINVTGDFDGSGCPTNFPMPPGSECYCLASINGNNYGIDGYACRKPAPPPEPPKPPVKWTQKTPNWERLSPEVLKRWLDKWAALNPPKCEACYYTFAGIERSCASTGGEPGSTCLCYEEVPGKIFPLRMPGKLCQAPDGSPR